MSSENPKRRRGMRIALAIGLLLATGGCGRWIFGTWAPATPGWSGTLVVTREAECSTFRLKLTGPGRTVVWQGVARPVDAGLRLLVQIEDGRVLDEYRWAVLTRGDDSLFLTTGDARVELRKR